MATRPAPKPKQAVPVPPEPVSEVTAARLDACLNTLAGLIEMGETQYVALFERLEEEFEAMERTESVEARIARRVASRRDKSAARGHREARSSEAA